MDPLTPSNSNQSPGGVLADSILSRQVISQLYRLTCLLTGDSSTAEPILSRVLEQFAPQLGQFRTEKHRIAFVVSKLREVCAKHTETAPHPTPPEGDAEWNARFSQLREPVKSALALFYLNLLPVGELAVALNLEMEELGALLRSGREKLGADFIGEPETKRAKSAQLLLACHRPGDSEEGRIAKAMKTAQNDPALQSLLQAQGTFDSDSLKQIETLNPPPSFFDRIISIEPQNKKVGLNVFRQPAFLSVSFALLVVIGVVFYSTWNRLHRFGGQDRMLELLEATQEMSGIELEPKISQLGLLGDWLFSKYAFENFQVPPELADFKTVGCRVYKQKGAKIAQIAVEPHHLIYFQFQAKDFGVKLQSKDGWRIFEQDDWAGAVRVYQGTCIMLALHGDQEEMEKILQNYPAKKN